MAHDDDRGGGRPPQRRAPPRRRRPDALLPASLPTLSAEVVREIFVKAAGNRKRLAAPSIDRCREAAKEIAAIGSQIVKSGEARADLLGNARQPLKQTAKILPAVRADLDGLFISGPASKLPDWHRDQLRGLVTQMGKIETAIAELFEAATEAEAEQGGGHPTWHELARLIHAVAVSAWRATSGSAPAGVRARTDGSDPAVVFVNLALSALGISVGEHAVSESLRKRERRLRGGAGK